MNKKIIIPAILLGVLSVGYVGVKNVQAEDNFDPRQSIISRLVARFNLKEADVQTVFEQERTERQNEMQAKFEANLSSLVSNGKITESQKQLILKKHQEIKDKRDSDIQNFQSMIREQKQQVRQQQHDELDAWAKANGIDTSLVFIGRGEGGRGMHRGN